MANSSSPRDPEWVASQETARRPGIRGNLDAYAHNPVIDAVEQALRALGATDRESAESALPDWPHTAELTDRERAAVLSRFDE